MATADTPPGDPTNGARNVALISTPSPNPRTVGAWGYTQHTWRYSLDVYQTHKTVLFNLSAQGDNTNQIDRQVSLNA